MICGSKGWGSLVGQADWATDSLDILSIEVKTARNLFKPSKVTLERVSSKDMSPFLGSVNSKTVTYHKDGWEEYRMLMPPVYKVYIKSVCPDSPVYDINLLLMKALLICTIKIIKLEEKIQFQF
jgi:hypothetical protein